MKNLFFNDISIYPLCESDKDVDERISLFVKLLRFCDFLGLKRIRFEKSVRTIELKKDFFFWQYLAQNARNSIEAQIILSKALYPFIESDSVEEEEYVNKTIRLNKEGRFVEAYGLSCAYLSGCFAIGFDSEDFWKHHQFSLCVKDDIRGDSHENKVFCISRESHFGNPDFIRWSVETLHLSFRDSNIPIEQKSLELREDHGIKELRAFSKRVLKENYVIGIVNSLPYDNKCKSMTKVKEDGMIDIRLLNTDKKIGIAVQTTAKNQLEALYLAEDIQQKYG